MYGTMDNQQVTQFDLGWLIGILDGEGCFCLHKKRNAHHFAASIKFVNTNYEIIEKLVTILKKLEIGCFVYNSYRSNNQRPAKRVEIVGVKRVKKFMDVLYPYLECRVDQAKQLKEFVELRLSKGEYSPSDEEEYHCYLMLQHLNKRGSSETTREAP